EGQVDRFSSHGAFVIVDGAQCYLPLSAMGEPPPRSAREVLSKGDTRTFVVQAFDAPRRGIELALPGFARVAAAPTDETVSEEIKAVKPARRAAAKKKAAAAPKKAVATKKKAAATTKKKAAAPKKTAAAPKKATTK